MVRWQDYNGNFIYVSGIWLNSTFVKCLIPKYTKPDVLIVELTLNGEDYTNDLRKYGFYDPYVLNAEPRLISVEGTTKVLLKGFGFVNSSQTKALFWNPASDVNCGGKPCEKTAEYLGPTKMKTSTYPQAVVNYNNGKNILWDPMTIDAAVYEDEFTDNNVQLWYYEEPDYQSVNPDESPANI